MKVVAFNCSPHKDGNTAHMVRTVLSELEAEGIETEFVQVGGKDLHGCKACLACKKSRNLMCIQKDDDLNDYIKKMVAADGIIIGSPTYFADLTPEAKALIDRSGYVLKSNDNPMKRKVGTPVVAVRRAGSIHVIDSITHFFTINDMFVVPSSYWNMSLARVPGDYEKDTEGVATMKNLGQNMAWLLKKLE
ncbi:MAG: flavodoxin family protein [Candidatus Methanomethylophilaceae archaeon]